MPHTLVRHRRCIALSVALIASSAAHGDALTVAQALAVPPAEQTNASTTLTAPILKSIEGGLRALNFRFTETGSIGAYPLIAPPVSGFRPLVAVTLTDQQGPEDLEFYALKQTTRVGNALGSGGTYTYLATLDSGGQSHILSRADTAAMDIANSVRAGSFEIEVAGASGSEFLAISDPLGVFITGVGSLTSAPGVPLQAPASSYRGQVHTSVLTVGEDNPDSVLPSIIGVPMFAHYAVNIRNTQTRRIITPGGAAVRTPTVEFVNHGANTRHQFKMALTLQDGLGAATTDPAFIPSFTDFDDFSNDPSTPTFWTFPIANVKLKNSDGTNQTQPFLFDTGAQVTVLSEATADSIGFDVGVDPADFEIDILGVGGISQAKGYFIPQLELPVIGGNAIFFDVPIIVLNVTDPRTGTGFVPGIIGMNLFTDRDLSFDMNRVGESAVYFSNAITPQWKLNTGGAWLPDANWELGVPDGADLPANFLGAITAASTINVDGDYTIGSMKFDNANSYTLNGTGRLTFETLGRPSKIEVVQGSHTVSSPLSLGERTSIVVAASAMLTLSGDSASFEAAVTKSGIGQLKLKSARFESLAVTQGSVQLIASASTLDGSRIEALQISNGATFDVTNRPVAVDYTSTSPIATIRADLAAGRLLSSLATPNRAVGYGEASTLGLTTFGGQTLNGAAVVLRLTVKGDADLDAIVDFDDLVALAQNYNLTGRYWTHGDFDYNGLVDFQDLIALAQNYGGSLLNDGQLPGGGIFAADWALAQSFVPEPFSLVAAGASIGFATVRRRR